MYNSFISPKKIIFGENAIKSLPDLISEYGAKKIMIFADPGVIDVGIVKDIEKLLDVEDIEYMVYSNLTPEPTLEVGEKALKFLKEFKGDLIVGIGGGSTLDIAKAVAVLHDNEGEIGQYLNLIGDKEINKKGLPKILIPTTSGTGAEVTDIAVFSHEDTKDVITHEFLMADVALIDPTLTYSLPSHITAATGVDALTHAVESFVSVRSTPFTDTLALEAIKKISRSLRTAVWDSNNKEARTEMSWGSLLAGQSFYNAGVAGVHALAYPLGSLFKIPHGQANALLLPYVFDYIWPSCLDKMVLVAEALDLKTNGLNKREVAIQVVIELKNIVGDVGLSTTLKEFDIEEKDINRLAENGLKQSRLLKRSPKPFQLEDIRECYKSACHGTLKLGR